MSWTLWRGDDCLGVLHERVLPQVRPLESGERHVNAVLIPDPAYLPLPSLHQRVVNSPGPRTVIERVREPDIDRASSRERPLERIEEVFVVSAGPAIPRPAVPRSRQLQVRDAVGAAVPTRYIAVLEHRTRRQTPSPELSTLPQGSIVGGSVWLVAFTEDSSAPEQSG